MPFYFAREQLTDHSIELQDWTNPLWWPCTSIKNCCFCVAVTAAFPCYAGYHRKKVLDVLNLQNDYRCCGGEFCGCKTPKQCNPMCMYVEGCLCPCYSVIGSRRLLMYNLEKKYTSVDGVMMHWIAYIMCLYCFLTIIGIETPDEMAFSEIIAFILLGMMITQQEGEIENVKKTMGGKTQGFYILDKVRYDELPRPKGYPKYLRPPQRNFPTQARTTPYPDPHNRAEMAQFNRRPVAQPQRQNKSKTNNTKEKEQLAGGAPMGNGGLSSSARGPTGGGGMAPMELETNKDTNDGTDI